MPFMICGLTSVISLKPPGLSSGLVYHIIATGLNVATEWLYLIVAHPAMYLSGVSAALKLVKAVRKSLAADGAYTIRPPQILVAGYALRSKRVTMPKLFWPPLRAAKRSNRDVALAFTISPLARTISKFRIESHAQPNRGEKNETPPRHLSAPRLLGVSARKHISYLQ